MKLSDAIADAAFTASFDARFPYDDTAKAIQLIQQGRAISLNAAFCVLHELCRLPQSNIDITSNRQRELSAVWSRDFEHPLIEPLLRCASVLVDGTSLPWTIAVAVMEQVSLFDGQRAALSLVYFSGNCAIEEGDTALNDADQRI